MKKITCPNLSELREEIINCQNPLRIIRGIDPIYSYYQEETGLSINIITGEIKSGKWAADINNAELLVPFDSPNALIQ